MLVKEAESVMAREGIHHKLAQEHWTGPWEVTEVALPGLSYIVTMKGRGIGRQRAALANIKMFHSRPDDLRHDFENEFAHLAWRVDFGLAESSIVASPMHTLIDRKAVMGQGNAWKVSIQGTFVDGTESQWLSGEQARDSFIPLQLNVFCALWEMFHRAECQARPTSTLTRKERDGIDREHALKQHPVGNVIWRESEDADGNKKRHLSKVFDCKSPYWRVWYADGDLEEPKKREILKARRTGNSQSGSP